MSFWGLADDAERLIACCPVVYVRPEDKKVLTVSHGLPVIRDENGQANFKKMVEAFLGDSAEREGA